MSHQSSRVTAAPITILALVLALPAASPAAAGVAIVDGTVYTLEDDQPRQATVLVDQGRIRAVDRDAAVPDGFETVDAAGRVITPGLIESHSELGVVEISGERSTDDAWVGLSTVEGVSEAYPLGPAFEVRYAINAASTLLPVNRMDGVTRAVVAPSPGNDPLSGWGAAMRLDDAGAVTHPRLAMFGDVGTGSATFVGGSRAAVVQRLRLALEQARSFRPDRVEPGEGEYGRRDLMALQGFLESGRPLVLTVQRANEIREAAALARDFDVPVVIHGGAEAWKVADVLARARVPVIVDALDNLPISFDQLGARLDNAALLHEAGVEVALTAEDTHNTRLIRQAAGNAVAEGMPWIAALAAITRRPAEILGLGDAVGTLAPGAPADLVIWSGDPLEVGTWAEQVMIAGEWVPMESRQTRLRERYRDLSGEKPFGYR